MIQIKQWENRRCDKKRNNDSTKVRDLVNAVRRNAQGKMNWKSDRFMYASSENITIVVFKEKTSYSIILKLKYFNTTSNERL